MGRQSLFACTSIQIHSYTNSNTVHNIVVQYALVLLQYPVLNTRCLRCRNTARRPDPGVDNPTLSLVQDDPLSPSTRACWLIKSLEASRADVE